MSAARKALFPPPAHMAQTEASDYLRRQVFEDALQAGWLKPCARKAGKGKDTIFYAWADVKDVSLRVAAGEYPGAAGVAATKKAKGGLQPA